MPGLFFFLNLLLLYVYGGEEIHTVAFTCRLEGSWMESVLSYIYMGLGITLRLSGPQSKCHYWLNYSVSPSQFDPLLSQRGVLSVSL